MTSTETTTRDEATAARARFREAHGFYPQTLSAAEAHETMDDLDERLVALVHDLADERSPAVDVHAAAGLAMQALHAEGHPSPTVRMGSHLDDLEAALAKARKVAAEINTVRGAWGIVSLEAICWRDLERHEDAPGAVRR